MTVVPAAASFAHLREEDASVSAAESTAVGSSRIRIRGAATSALAISTICCWATLSRPTRRADVDVAEAELGEHLAGAPVGRAPVDHATAGPRVGIRPRRMFSATLRCGQQAQLLVHGARCRARSPRRGLGDRRPGLPSIRIVAAVGRDGAGEDLHQRRLAGAVLAAERQHLAGLGASKETSFSAAVASIALADAAPPRPVPSRHQPAAAGKTLCEEQRVLLGHLEERVVHALAAVAAALVAAEGQVLDPDRGGVVDHHGADIELVDRRASPAPRSWVKTAACRP